MSFLDTVRLAKTQLRNHGRVSLSALKLEFDLDDATLEALIGELVDVQAVAARDGKVLSWIGAVPAGVTAAPKPWATSETSLPPAPPQGPPEAERRQLTVMFCDMVGSTDLSQRLDAEDLRDVVRAYQQSATEAIERYDGHVAQFLGDGLLVYFGYPRAHEDDAERAVRTGREILVGLESLNEQLERDYGVRIAARIGIHTGPVVVGTMGSGGKRETLALGETTNIAGRLEGIAEANTMVISAATLRLVAGMFATADFGMQTLKGLAEPIQVYSVLQGTGVRSRLDASAGRLTPFVGRQTELGVLADAWDHVLEGIGQTVLVMSEAGLGKSRLCYQLRERLSGEPHTWLECRCSPHTAGTAFRPVTELVEQALGFAKPDTPADKLAKLGAGLENSGLAAGEEVSLLAEWLGLPESAGYTRLAAAANTKRGHTLATLAAWNLKLGELQPAVLLFEDLHWCDPSSLELLGRLVEQSATARVLLVCTARTEFECPWPTRENLQTLHLQRLTKRQAREMIGAVAPGLPEQTVEQLVVRSDGVPLYTEELTRAVVEAEGDSSAADIPVTLQDSLLARLDRLASAKQVAQRAAVLGREFTYELLEATAGIDEMVLLDGLKRLAAADLLFVRGEPPDASYIFKHALVQEAAYHSLLNRKRQQLHGRVADALAAEFPERAAAEPELVARHAELAGRIDDAVAGFRRAGEQAQARSAYEEALRHQRQAIQLLAAQPPSRDRDAYEAALQFAFAGSVSAARGYVSPEIEPAYERARVLCDALGDARGRGWAIAGLSYLSYQSGQVARAGVLAERVLEIAEETSDADLALRAHIDLDGAELWQGRFNSSLAHCDAALALYRPDRNYLLDSGFSINDPSVMALGNSAWNLWMLGRPDRALACATDAVAVARRLDHPYPLTYALFNEAVVHWLRGEVEAQRDGAAEAMALSREHGFRFWLGVTRTWNAAARVDAGETEAQAELMPGLAQSGGTGSRAGAPALFHVLGEANFATGHLAEARDAVAGGLELAAQTGQHFFDAELHRLRAEIDLASGGAPADVSAVFLRALEIARAQRARSAELRAATSLARLWQTQGRSVAARALLQPVYDEFAEGFGTKDLMSAKALLEELG